MSSASAQSSSGAQGGSIEGDSGFSWKTALLVGVVAVAAWYIIKRKS